MIKSLVSAVLVASLVLSGCSDSTEDPVVDSAPTQDTDVDSGEEVAPEESEVPESESVPAPSPQDEVELSPESPVDRLLPDDVINAYIPSYEIEFSNVSSEGQSDFPDLESVRPKKCGALLQFDTFPLASPTGELAGASSNLVSMKPPDGISGPSFYEKIWTYPSESDALAAFDSAKSALSDCTDSSAEWPQTGSIRMNDGMNRVSLEVGKIRTETDSLVVMQGRKDYTDEIRDYWSFALVKDSIVWMQVIFYGDVAKERRGEIFDAFVEDAVEYATTGDLVSSSDADNATTLTLECLSLSPLPFSLIENYSRFSGPGAGEDLFVKARISATNNCGKPIEGFQYDEKFVDSFGDVLLSGNGTFKKRIKPGATRKTEANQGYIVSSTFGTEDIEAFLSAGPQDITQEAVVTQILFVDGTSLP